MCTGACTSVNQERKRNFLQYLLKCFSGKAGVDIGLLLPAQFVPSCFDTPRFLIRRIVIVNGLVLVRTTRFVAPIGLERVVHGCEQVIDRPPRIKRHGQMIRGFLDLVAGRFPRVSGVRTMACILIRHILVLRIFVPGQEFFVGR